MLTTEHLNTIYVALLERRNRLIQLDLASAANDRGERTLRQRINEVTDAIKAVKELKHGA